MCLQLIIKKYLCICFALISTLSLKAQPFQTSKYNRESNSYFKFEKFERGINSEILAKQLDILEQKDKTQWTVLDSIKFAEISLLTKNIELSKYYLESLEQHNHSSKEAMKLLLMDCYINKDFLTGDRIANTHFSENSTYNIFFKSIYNSHKKSILTNESDSLIFNILKPNNSSVKRGTEEYQLEIITPVQTANQVLRFFVKFIHEDDPTLARAFNELGLVLESEVSLNQAYIAYSIARIYNNRDKNILENVKRIKAKHIKRNYNTPKFRTYFPRIEYWRFDYEILKEKIILKKNDTIPKFTPSLLANSTDIEFPINKDLLVPIGVLLIFLLFTIFTSSKKR
ncbi:MAG: hypothetical protein AB8B74_04805 [Crocinitomicaceae bacterium]